MQTCGQCMLIFLEIAFNVMVCTYVFVCVCVCACVCVCVCVHACLRMCVGACLRMCVGACLHVRVRACMHVCMCQSKVHACKGLTFCTYISMWLSLENYTLYSSHMRFYSFRGPNNHKKWYTDWIIAKMIKEYHIAQNFDGGKLWRFPADRYNLICQLFKSIAAFTVHGERRWPSAKKSIYPSKFPPSEFCAIW